MIFPACASPEIEKVLDHNEKRREREWSIYNSLVEDSKTDIFPELREAARRRAEARLKDLKLLLDAYYVKTPYVCAYSLAEGFYHTHLNHILCEYELYGGIPVCSIYYLQSDAGMFFLNMEYTRDGKKFTASQKTQMPGERVRGIPFDLYAENDQEAIEERQTIAHLFGVFDGDHRNDEFYNLSEAWDLIWNNPDMGAEATVKALSNLLQFPLLFPLFPCKEAKLVKSNQGIERYVLANDMRHGETWGRKTVGRQGDGSGDKVTGLLRTK